MMTRTALFAVAAVALLTAAAQAQTQKQSPVQRSPAAAPANAPPQQAPGYYAAPPANGTYAGASNSVGVEGMALHFPAMSLKLPTLQFPSLFNLRTPPKMLMAPGQAPYIEHQQPKGVGAPVAVQAIQAAPSNRSPEPVRSPAQKSTQKRASYDGSSTGSQDEVAQLRAQVAALLQRLESQQNGPHAAFAPTPAPRTIHSTRQASPDTDKLERLETQVRLLHQAVSQLTRVRQNAVSPVTHLTPVPHQDVAARLQQPRQMAAQLAAPLPAPLPNARR